MFDSFGSQPAVCTVPDPTCPPDGAVVAVRATGVCRSDWHAWMGHDSSVVVPHVPGHEFSGVVIEVGSQVRRWRPGQRVTAPFVHACRACATCRAGDEQVCPHQSQPGFTRWGSFADAVVVEHADTNLVALPDELGFVEAASLGCRFATAYRAVVHHGRPAPGDWLAVYGCGGVGLAAVMVAASRGARVVAVDIAPEALRLARALGAEVVLDAREADVARRVREVTGGGARLSLDAIGRAAVLADALAGLRPRGRHVQVGLLLGRDADPAIDMGLVVGREIEVVGSHGMAAHHYGEMLAEIASGRLDPAALVVRTVGLDEASRALTTLDSAALPGTTVVVLGAAGTGPAGPAGGQEYP